jgi:hypothetical protein
LLSRDITPEDYDMLLRLDTSVPKATASADAIDAMPCVLAEEFLGGSCSVCLAPFEEADTVAALACRHRFHRTCITRWLSECKKTCPLCGNEAMASKEEVSQEA